jgi:hypothetical protein
VGPLGPGVPLRVLHTEYAHPDRLRYESLHNHFDLVLTAALRARPDVVPPGSPFRCT